MSTKVVLIASLIAYLIAALVVIGLHYWRDRAFRNCEQEFCQLATELESVVSECLADFDDCSFQPDPNRAVERLLYNYQQNGLLDYMEEDYETLKHLIDRMTRLSLPAQNTRLLDCHKRLILLDRALDACNFPQFCIGLLTAWTPGPDGFLFALNDPEKRAQKRADF